MERSLRAHTYVELDVFFIPPLFIALGAPLFFCKLLPARFRKFLLQHTGTMTGPL